MTPPLETGQPFSIHHLDAFEKGIPIRWIRGGIAIAFLGYLIPYLVGFFTEPPPWPFPSEAVATNLLLFAFILSNRNPVSLADGMNPFSGGVEIRAFVIQAVVLLAMASIISLGLKYFGRVLATAGANERRVSDILAGDPDGVIALDDKCRIEAYNPAAESLLGIPAASAMGLELEALPLGGGSRMRGGWGRTSRGWSSNAKAWFGPIGGSWSRWF